MIKELTDPEIDIIVEKLAKKLTDNLKSLIPVKPEYLSVKDAATYCGMSVDHLREQINMGEIPATNIGSPDRATYRISLTNLEEFMKRKEAGALCPPSVRKSRREGLPTSPHLGRKRLSR